MSWKGRVSGLTQATSLAAQSWERLHGHWAQVLPAVGMSTTASLPSGYPCSLWTFSGIHHHLDQSLAHFKLYSGKHVWWRRQWQPTPVFLPGESQGRGAWWASVYGVTQSRTRLRWLSSSSKHAWHLFISSFGTSWRALLCLQVKKLLYSHLGSSSS